MSLATAPAVSTRAPQAPVRHPGELLTSGQRLTYILLLGALVALGPFTVDLYLPAFPDVARDLGASDAAIQLTLTATMVGFGLGQLIVGPLSDALGRRRPLLIATSVHILASVAVAFAPTVAWVTAGRVVQGIGAAGGAVVAMAVVRDLFGGQPLIRMLARMALVTGLAPVLAPVIGSQLLRVTQWRGIFLVLAAYGLVMTIVAAVLISETLPIDRRGAVSAAVIRGRYRRLLTDPVFVGVLVVGAMGFTSLFSYLSSSSFLLQDRFGLSPQQFGLVFGVNSLGLVIASQTSSRLMRRFAPRSVMSIGVTVMLVGAVTLFTLAQFGGGLAALLIPLFFVVASFGLTMPTVQTMALADHGSEAGTAASLLGAMNFGVAGAISPLVGALGISVASMAGVMVGALLVAHLSLWFVVRPRASRDVLI